MLNSANQQQKQERLDNILQLRYQLTHPDHVYPITGEPRDNPTFSPDVIAKIEKDMISSLISANSSSISSGNKKNPDNSTSHVMNSNTVSGSNQWSSLVAPLKSYMGSEFPDFYPWKHTELDDIIAVRGISKGAAVKPFVNNELVSARHLMHYYLRLESEVNEKNSNDENSDGDQDSRNNDIIKLRNSGKGNKSEKKVDKKSFKTKTEDFSNKNSILDQFSEKLLISITKRSKVNGISDKSTFKPPPRVTLTEKKKELWMNNLADSTVSLRKLSRSIPHGIRSKTLLDQLIEKEVPINRAVWFVKCIALNELRLLKRKQLAGSSSSFYSHLRNNSSSNNNVNNMSQHHPQTVNTGGFAVFGNSKDARLPEFDNNENIWINEWTQLIANYLKNALEISPSNDNSDSKYTSDLGSGLKRQKKHDKNKEQNSHLNSTDAAANHDNGPNNNTNDIESNNSNDSLDLNNDSNNSKLRIIYLHDLIVQLFSENLINKKLFLSFFINSIIADCGSVSPSLTSTSEKNENNSERKIDALHFHKKTLNSNPNIKQHSEASIDESNTISNTKSEKMLALKIDNSLIRSTADNSSLKLNSLAKPGSTDAILKINNAANILNHESISDANANNNEKNATNSNNIGGGKNNNLATSRVIDDKYDFEKLYFAVNLFLKCYVGLMVKNYIIETTQLESSGSERFKTNNAKNGSLFYTNSLKQLIEILIIKYNFIAKKFNSEHLISIAAANESSLLNTDNTERLEILSMNSTATTSSNKDKNDIGDAFAYSSDNEQNSCVNTNILLPVTPINNKKSFFINAAISKTNPSNINNHINSNNTGNNTYAVNSPYGLNILNSPYSAVENSVMMTPEHNDSFIDNNNTMNFNTEINNGADGKTHDENNGKDSVTDVVKADDIDKYEESKMEKLNYYIYKLRKAILVTIKLLLMHLFSLNNGELFILPKSNWPLLKKILLKYNILNTRKNQQNLFVSLKIKENNKEENSNKIIHMDNKSSNKNIQSVDAMTSNHSSHNTNNGSNDFLSEPESNKNKRMKNIMHEIAARSPVNVTYPPNPSKVTFFNKSPVANQNRFFAPPQNPNSSIIFGNNSNVGLASKSSSSHHEYEQATTKKSLDSKNQIMIYDSNTILKHGMNLNITKENFIIANNSRILLTKQFEVISSRNDSLLSSISSSLKQLHQYKNLNNDGMLISKEANSSKKVNLSKTLSGPSLLLDSLNSCDKIFATINFLNTLTDLASYKFFYLSDLKVPTKSSGIVASSELSTPIVNRRFSFNSVNSTNSNKIGRRLSANASSSGTPTLSFNNDDYVQKLLMPEFQQSIFNDNIELLIDSIFGDFSSIIDILSSTLSFALTNLSRGTNATNSINLNNGNSVFTLFPVTSGFSMSNISSTTSKPLPGGFPKSNCQDSSQTENINYESNNQADIVNNSNLLLVREKLQFLLRYAVAGRIKGLSAQNKSLRRTQLVVYIIKQIMNKFKYTLSTVSMGVNNMNVMTSTNNNIIQNKANTMDNVNSAHNNINPSARESPIDAFCHESLITENVIVDETKFEKQKTALNNQNTDSNSKNVTALHSHYGKPSLNKKQLIAGFRTFIEGEIFDFLFSLYTPQKSNKNFDDKYDNADSEFESKIEELFRSLDNFKNLRVEIDSKLISLLRKRKYQCEFNLKDSKIFFHNEKPNLHCLLLLMNSLFEARLISVNVYIRKLISSGILYLRNLKNFYDLNLFQYIILRNFSYKINSNGILVKNNNTQINLILSNLKRNLFDYINEEKNLENFKLEGSIFSDESDRKLIITSIKATEISHLENIVNNVKSKIELYIIDQIFEDKISDISIDEIVSSDFESAVDIPVRLYLSGWFYEQLINKILSAKNSNEKIVFTVYKLSLLNSIFKIFRKSDYLFNFLRLILTLFIKPEIILILNQRLNAPSFSDVDLGYDSLYYILGLLFDHLNVINFFQDYGNCEVQFESKYSLSITTINIKKELSNKEKYIKSIDILKLAINSYLKLNDISNSIFEFFSSTKSGGFASYGDRNVKEKRIINKINCYDFIKYWSFFLQSLEDFEFMISNKENNIGDTKSETKGTSKQANSEYQNPEDEVLPNILNDDDSSDSNEIETSKDIDDSANDSNDESENCAHEDYELGSHSIYVDPPTLNNIRAQLEYLTTEPNTKFNTDYFKKNLHNQVSIQLSEEISEHYPDFTFELLINMNEFGKNFDMVLNYIVNYEASIPNDHYISSINILFLFKKASQITFIASVLKVIKNEVRNTNKSSNKIIKLIYLIILNGLVDARTIISSLVANRDYQKIIDDNTFKAIEPNDDYEAYAVIFGNNFSLKNSINLMVKLPKDILAIIHDIIFYNSKVLKLSASNEHSLKSHQCFFRKTFYNEYADIMIVFMSSKVLNGNSRSNIENFICNMEDYDLFIGKATQNISLFNYPLIIGILNDILFGIESEKFGKIDDFSQIYKLISNINLANYPILLVLFSALVNCEILKHKNNKEQIVNVRMILMRILTCFYLMNLSNNFNKPFLRKDGKEELSYLKSEDKKLFVFSTRFYEMNKICINNVSNLMIAKNLFNFLRDDIKRIFMVELERIFLRSTEFPELRLINIQGAFEEKFLKICNKYNNFIPYAAIIIDSVSNDLINEGCPIINSSLGPFLSNFVDHITKYLVKNYENTSVKVDKKLKVVSKSIYLFLNVLHTHKISIIQAIYQKSNILGHNFIPGLINLLEFKYFAKFIQLRNMLYDFLFSIKSNIKELNKSNYTFKTIQAQGQYDKIDYTHNEDNTISGGQQSADKNMRHGNDNQHQIILPKLSNDELNVELTKRLVGILEREDRLALCGEDKLYEDLILRDLKKDAYYNLKVNALDFLEDANPTIGENDTSINMKLFDTVIIKSNTY